MDRNVTKKELDKAYAKIEVEILSQANKFDFSSERLKKKIIDKLTEKSLTGFSQSGVEAEILSQL